MISIFVAKDSPEYRHANEFERYRQAFNLSVKNRRIHQFVSSNMRASGSDDEYLIWKYAKSESDDICAVLKICTAQKDDVLQNFENPELPMTVGARFIEHLAGIFLKAKESMCCKGDGSEDLIKVLNACLKEYSIKVTATDTNMGDEPPPDSECYGQSVQPHWGFAHSVQLFVHWGGGSPIKYEQLFQAAYNKDKQVADENQYMARLCPNLRAFAISSRREPCFNVNTDTIEIPCTLSEMRQIVNRFSLDLIKDTLSGYIIENEVRKERGEDAGCYFVGQDKVENLRQYLEYCKTADFLNGFSGEESQWMAQYLAMPELSDIGSSIRFHDDIAALFVRLIREGVRHG